MVLPGACATLAFVGTDGGYRRHRAAASYDPLRRVLPTACSAHNGSSNFKIAHSSHVNTLHCKAPHSMRLIVPKLKQLQSENHADASDPPNLVVALIGDASFFGQNKFRQEVGALHLPASTVNTVLTSKKLFIMKS